MLQGRTTLSKFVIEQLRDKDDHSELGALIIDIAAAIKSISAMVAKGALGGYLGTLESEKTNSETQYKLDSLTNEAMLQHCEWGGQLAGMASEEMDATYPIPAEYPRGRYVLIFDPLDGSSKIDVNAPVGTIFSVHDVGEARDAATKDFMQIGKKQVVAGYALYGPSTMMVISLQNGTHGFTLDRESGNFILTHPDIRIKEDTSEFSINTSNERFWEPPVVRYVSECKAGKTGARERDFNIRWIASMVAEVHRILMRGGIFMYPKDSKDDNLGRLRLLFEASPMSMLIEQAGGRATTGREDILAIKPQELHYRVPLILGSKNEVERLIRYHVEFDNGTDKPFESPLFGERSMFRD